MAQAREVHAWRGKMLLVAAILLLWPGLAGAQQDPQAAALLTPPQREAVINGTIQRFQKSYLFPDKVQAIEAALREHIKRGDYDAVNSGPTLAEALTKDLRSLTQDQHVQVRFSPKPLPPMGEVEREPTAEERQRLRQIQAATNFGFFKVERLQGNVGYLDLDSFADPEFGGEAAVAAMAFLANTDALIIDLRYNGGGNSRMVAFLASFLFEGDSVHLTDLAAPAVGFLKQSWTMPYVPGRRFAGKDVYVLTSKKTFSAAEEFAYSLQSLKRATIIGETTRGGAHTASWFRVTENFGLMLPVARAINPVTGSNWERVGVTPDVQIPNEEAIRKAHAMALRRLLEKDASGLLAEERQRVLTKLEEPKK